MREHVRAELASLGYDVVAVRNGPEALEAPERAAIVAGYIDSVGSASWNFSLSQRRADQARFYRMRQEVSSTRLHAIGKGEYYLETNNDSATGCQLNGRVEVLISDTAMRSRGIVVGADGG